jgi:nitrilase
MHREKGILYAEIDPEAARRARRSLDVCGHYARPDIFSLSVNRNPLDPVTFSG